MLSSRSRTAALPAPVRRCFPVLLLPAFGALASAQSVGAISGSIRDSAGVPIPGVEVVLLQLKGAVYSDSVGVFRFGNISPGKRELHFRRLGFAPKSLDANITEGQTLALAVVLEASATQIEGMTVDVMALVIASLAWLYPARTIRSQVLTLRERAYVQIARLSDALAVVGFVAQAAKVDHARSS